MYDWLTDRSRDAGEGLDPFKLTLNWRHSEGDMETGQAQSIWCRDLMERENMYQWQ